jgi:hypothetical protein
VAVELAHAHDERVEVTLDLGELHVDAGRRAGVGGIGEQLGELGETVADGVEHGRLQADRMAQRLEREEHPADRGLAPSRERPLQVLALELLWRGVVAGVVLRDVEVPPLDEGCERPDEHGLIDRLVPPRTVERAAHLVDVERRGDDGGVLERGHQRDVKFVQRARREPEEVPVDPSPRPL